jgi:hypothetical protein
MQPSDVPAEIVEVAEKAWDRTPATPQCNDDDLRYVLAAVIPAVAARKAEASEHGELRDQIAEKIRQRLGSQLELFPHAAEFLADGVVELLGAHVDALEQRQRAEQAEAELAQWRHVFGGTAELEATRARLARLEQAETAIERALAYCADRETRMAAQGVDRPPWIAMVRGLLSPAGGSEKKGRES